MSKRKSSGWLGFDLDKTLAYYDGVYRGPTHIGEPIQPMVDLIKRHIRNGQTCKIFTARADETYPEYVDAIKAIQDWCELHIGKRLEVTNRKDRHMWLLYDDRAIQIEPNTGRIIRDSVEAVNLNTPIREAAE